MALYLPPYFTVWLGGTGNYPYIGGLQALYLMDIQVFLVIIYRYSFFLHLLQSVKETGTSMLMPAMLAHFVSVKSLM